MLKMILPLSISLLLSACGGSGNSQTETEITMNTPKNIAKSISLDAHDVDGDTLAYLVVSAPAHGSVFIAGSVATYTPENNYSGRDSFTYNADDGTEDLNIATVKITISTGKLNDTGILKCANRTEAYLACPISTHPNQDAQTGRDVTHNDDSDGQAGFSFTKINNIGAELPASATSWSCVKDNVTGLIWEVKTDDGGLHDKYKTYTWYNPDASTNGGNAGTESGSADTDSFVSEVNSTDYCGANNWRMPTRQELRSLINYSMMNSFDLSHPEYFPGALLLSYSHAPQASLHSREWSSSPYASDSKYAWVFVVTGNSYILTKRNRERVRLVRSGQ